MIWCHSQFDYCYQKLRKFTLLDGDVCAKSVKVLRNAQPTGISPEMWKRALLNFVIIVFLAYSRNFWNDFMDSDFFKELLMKIFQFVKSVVRGNW